jgi:exopolysaccharide biosynthesis polyprenyl glycosylphosphotransferase
MGNMNLIRKDLPNKYLLLVDLCSILLSFLLATWIRYGGITREWIENMYGVAFAIILLVYIAVYYLYDTYSRLFKRGFIEELITVTKINCWQAATLSMFMFILQEGATYSRLFFVSFFLINILITYIARQYFKVLLLAVYKKSDSSSKLMIVTTSDQAKSVLNHIRSENEWKFQVTYLTILDKHLIGQMIEGIPVKADFLNMFEVAKQEVLDSIFIHIPSDCPLNLDLEETILEFENMGVTVNLSINTFGLKVHEKIVREISGYHVLTFSTRLFTESQLQLKRLMDIIGGLIGSILTILLILFLAPLIIIESPGPIFFSQIRVGKNGRRFKIYKFRSMYMDAEARKAELLVHNEMNGYMFKMTDDPRITKVGKILRKSSLDEFPQFFNILKGDMSLVGTRPPTEAEFLLYEGRHKRRLTLKCGLTGLWQVSGRSGITDFEDVVKMDLEYIDNWSFKMDVKILLKTVGVVLFGKGSK